jgi:hypothetical protein
MRNEQGRCSLREVIGKRSVLPRVGEGMVVRRVLLRARDVVFFKGVVEGGGDLHVAAPMDRAAELDAMLAELCTELGAVRLGTDVGSR